MLCKVSNDLILRISAGGSGGGGAEGLQEWLADKEGGGHTSTTRADTDIDTCADTHTGTTRTEAYRGVKR